MKYYLILFVLFLSFTALAGGPYYFAAPVTGTAGASAQVLAQNSLRNYLIIQNTGSTILIVKFGSAISSSNEGMQVAAGGAYEPVLAPASAVYIKALSGSPTYTVIQGN